MEEIMPSSSPPPQVTTGTATTTTTSDSTAKRKREKTSVMSRVKKQLLSFAVSLQESLRYIKAKFVGQAKKITARNEKEATAANLQAAKMEVGAADEAENIKKNLDKFL